MFRILFLLLVSFNVCLAQTNRKHVVYFKTDKYNVLETEQNRLLLFIQELEREEIKRVSIYGFCDDRGTDQYNLGLSQNRANAIKDVFSGSEIKQSLITNVDGKGEILLKRITSENVNIIRGLNRKVEIEIEYKSNKKRGVVKKNKETVDNKKIDDKGRVLPLTLESELIVGDKIVLKDILFQTGYSYILKESIPVLKNVVKKLKEKGNLYFTIEGHVCCTTDGSDAIDRRTGRRNLSLTRAQYIYNYLVRNGISKKRMKFIGLKHKFPLGGDTKFDRRVEIEITYIKN
tara:strand:+ start:316 stop:1182 length:867 start_codon:yes stop_codon:yes gene_type:complete